MSCLKFEFSSKHVLTFFFVFQNKIQCWAVSSVDKELRSPTVVIIFVSFLKENINQTRNCLFGNSTCAECNFSIGTASIKLYRFFFDELDIDKFAMIDFDCLSLFIMKRDKETTHLPPTLWISILFIDPVRAAQINYTYISCLET